MARVSTLERECALEGATLRLAKLESEVTILRKLFPELVSTAAVAPPRKAVKDGRSQWTAKRKREHKKRMQAFWTAKRLTRAKDRARKAVKREHAKTVSAKETR